MVRTPEATRPACCPPHFRSVLALLLGLALLGGCSKGTNASGAHWDSALQRLDFGDPTLAAPELDLELVARIELPESAADWEVLARRAEILPAQDERPPALMLFGEGDLEVVIPLEPGLGDFNMVAVELTNARGTTVAVRFSSAGEPVLGGNGKFLPGTSGPQVVLFKFPQARLQASPFEELRISFQSTGRVQALHAVELLHCNPATFLPDANSGAQPVEIDQTDARRAVALSNERPLKAPCVVPAGARLRLSYGLPQRLRAPTGGADYLNIEVRAAGKGRRAEQRVHLDWNKLTGGWQELDLDLAELEGNEAEVTLRLESGSQNLVLLAIAEARVVVPQEGPATVVLVTSDTHRYDHVSSAGRGVDVRTTNIDALGERGVFFSNCFTSTNSTNPSHVALLTGRHPRDTGVLDNNSPIAPEAPTLAQRFAEAGYTTLAVLSARHLGHDTSGLGTGFDRVGRPKLAQRRSHASIDELLHWTATLGDEPLFVWLHVFDAHTPYQPPEPHFTRHWDSERDPFDPALPELEGVPPSVFAGDGTYAGLRDLEYPLAQYRAEVDSLDEELGRVFDHPRLGRGVLALTADHGELLGHHDCYYDHAGVYPGTIHVPLALAWPEGAQGVRVDRPVTHLDLGRTILNLAGLESADFPGRDLVAPLAGGPEPPDEPRFALAAHGLSCAITLGEWHLILHVQPNGPHSDSNKRVYQAHQVQLFHLGRDPDCATDLVDELPDVARRLREQLVRWMTNPEPTGWARSGSTDEETVRQLTELGYTLTEFGKAPEGLKWEPDSCEWCQRFE